MDEAAPRSTVDKTKRRYFKYAGAGLMSSVMPLWRRADAAAIHYDIVVVGGGTVAMTLAIFAAARKARVLVIETSPIIGGSLPMTGGAMAAAGTVFQRQQGIVDNPDMHYDDIMRISKNTADPALTRLYVDNAPAMIDWMAARGYRLRPGEPTKETNHEDFSVRRYHGTEGSGKAIFEILNPLFDAAVASKHVVTQLNATAVDLLQEKDGRVIGVLVQPADEPPIEVFGRSIVLACGGCAANPRMYADLHGVPLYSSIAYPFSQGMGITLGIAAGGQIWRRDCYIPQFGSLLDTEELPAAAAGTVNTNPKSRSPWEIYVNAEGKRFVREDEMQNWLREWALRGQTGHHYWILFDQEAMDRAPPLIPRWSAEKFRAAFNSHPMFASGPTLRAVAVRAGVNPLNLVATVEGYNASLRDGSADALGREARPAPIGRGPFYAIRMTGTAPVSFAGLQVDGGLRVVTSSGQPVPNLYAAGEVIGGGAIAGNRFVGGSILTPALTFGRLLGEKMLVRRSA